MGRIYHITALFLICVSILCSVHAQQTERFQEPEALYQKGLELFQLKKYSAAKSLMDQYIAATEGESLLKTTTAEYYSALCALYLGNPTAEQELDYFSKNHSEHAMAPFAYYELGMYYYNNKKYDKVIEVFVEVDADLLSVPQRDEMRFKLAYSYFSQRNFSEARRLFDRIKNHPHQYQSAAAYYAGYIAYEEGDYDAAYRDFMSIANDPQYKKAVEPNILKILYKQERYKEIIDFAEKSKANDTESTLFTAEAYFFLDRYDEAEKHYDKYVSRTRRVENEVVYRIGYVKLQNKKYNEAVDYFKQSALEDTKLGQNSAYNLGICYLNTGRKDYALGAFIHASDLDFDKKIKEEALVSFAKLCYENKNYQDAITSLKKLNQEYPNSSHFKENEELLADAYLHSSNYRMALDYLEGIKSMSHNEKIAYQNAAYNLGVAEYNQRNYEKALTYFDKSLRYPIDKNLLLAACFWTAESYSVGKRFDEAKKYYARIFENDPLKTSEYYLKTRYGIAYAYYNTKEYDKALNHFKYYTLNEREEPLYVIDATTRMADCHYIALDYDNAIKAYREVKKQQKLHHNYAAFQLGVIEFRAGRTEEAKADLDEIINHHKDSPYYDDALYQRAYIDLKSEAFAAAVAGFSDLIDYKPKNNLVPLAYSQRAIAYANLNKAEKELADYLYIMNNYITHPEASKALQSLSTALAKTGREDEFSSYLEKYKKANPQATDLEGVEFDNAKALYFASNYASAIKALEKFITNHPSTAQAFESKYYLAESYRKTNEVDKAIRWFEAVISDNATDYVIRSIYKIAELYFDKADYDNANTKYALLLERAQGPRDITRALEGQLKCAYAMEQDATVREMANKLRNSGFANDEQKEEAKLYAAKSAIRMGNTAEAVTELTSIITNNPGETGAEANYLLAKIKYDAGEYEQSKDALYKLNKAYAGYDYWIGKSYLLIARNLIAQEEDFQAKATLNSIIEYSKVQEVVKEAKELLKQLNKQVEQEKQAADSTGTEDEHIIDLTDEE